MTICYCSPCLVVRTFNACKNSRFSSVCSIVALGRTNECLILPLVPLLMFFWTKTLGSESLLYYAVNSCIIHHHQSMMTEIEQSQKYHKFIVYWHGRSLNGLCYIQLLWKLGISYKIYHSVGIQFFYAVLVMSSVTLPCVKYSCKQGQGDSFFWSHLIYLQLTSLILNIWSF